MRGPVFAQPQACRLLGKSRTSDRKSRKNKKNSAHELKLRWKLMVTFELKQSQASI
jgi:hypothetical protein